MIVRISLVAHNHSSLPNATPLRSFATHFLGSQPWSSEPQVCLIGQRCIICELARCRCLSKAVGIEQAEPETEDVHSELPDDNDDIGSQTTT